MPNNNAHILITRHQNQATEFIQAVKKNDVVITCQPFISITPQAFDTNILTNLINKPEQSLLLLTSANGAQHFFEPLNTAQKETLSHMEAIAVGHKTAEAAANGINNIYTSPYTTAKQAILWAKEKQYFNGKQHLIWPTGNLADDLWEETLPNNLTLHTITCYHTTLINNFSQTLNDNLITANIIALTSASNAQGLYHYTHQNKLVLNNPTIVSIGPSTSVAVNQHFSQYRHIQSAQATLTGLANTCQYLMNTPTNP